MKKAVSIVLAIIAMFTLSIPTFAAEPATLESNENEVVVVEVFEIEDNMIQPRASLFSQVIRLTTSSMKELWNSGGNNQYKNISCYNYGDIDTGSGAIRFTINGVTQDVDAGTGATFRVPTGQVVSITSKALWYNGYYNIAIVGSKL